MFRIALVYGSISGILIIALMLLGMQTGAGHSMWFGYLTMVVVLSLIFVGVKRYRDNQLGGVVKFIPAFGLGLAIAAVAGVFYVISWEISLQLTDFAFVNDYVAGTQAAYEAKGLTGEALAAKMEVWENWSTAYMNPLYRWPLTFIEIFPVGLIVALIGAAVLRNPKMFPARS